MHRTAIALALLLGCTSSPRVEIPDAGTDAAPPIDGVTNETGLAVPDVSEGDAGCEEVTAIHSLLPASLVVPPESQSTLLLRLARDRRRCAGDYRIEVRGAIGRAPARVSVPVGAASVELPFNAARNEGSGSIVVTQEGLAGDTGAATVTVPVQVRAETAVGCPTGARASLGVLRAGEAVEGRLGELRVGLRAPANTEGLPAEAIRVQCAERPIALPYREIGPAVTFGPGSGRLSRELVFTLPVNGARVPPRYATHIEVAWTPPGPGATERIVPVSEVVLSPEGTAVSFRGYRLGTYRPVIRPDLGQPRSRRVTYRGIYGISMGAVGASTLGVRNLARFDLIAALGGAADSITSGAYLRNYVFGGFCTAAERARLGDTACATSDPGRTPPPFDLNFSRQDFEHFFAPPGGGTGGTFDRRARFRGFRDIARAFGNPVMRADPANALLPLGVPAGEITRSDVERCRDPVVLGGPMAPMDARFYDDEYNPEGRFAAISFCDGGIVPGMVGTWDGNVGNYPVEITLAIDLNGNRRRDPGEPVVRNFSEPYLDLGADNLASRDEGGFDPETNPDPAGDDYDRVYNPGGTEGNQDRDEGERFEDLGLDGVACPAGRTCPYDTGEGNGRFDTSQGEGAITRRANPRTLLATAPREEVLRVSQWLDGGIRDALQFGLNANHYAGVLAQRDAHLRVLDGFAALLEGRSTTPETERAYRVEDLDFERMPARTLLRYGSLEAPREEILAGDGAHVGTTAQITHRLITSLLWASSRWPGGDRRLEPFTPSSDSPGRCANGYQCTFDFRAPSTGRSGQVVVVLPPGYHDPANAALRYPVLYLLHGYGMQPVELAATGLVAATRMVSREIPAWARPQKFIMVFPDGACRPGDGCQEGTFYVDSPAGSPRMERFFLDLMEWVDTNLRTRPAEDVQVVE